MFVLDTVRKLYFSHIFTELHIGHGALAGPKVVGTGNKLDLLSMVYGKMIKIMGVVTPSALSGAFKKEDAPESMV